MAYVHPAVPSFASAIVALSAACSSPASQVSTPRAPSGRAERLQIGALEAYALADGYLEIPNDGHSFVLDRSPGEVGDVLASAKLSRDTLRLDLQCLLVRDGARVLLFDTGVGAFSTSEPMLAHTGHLASSLALANIAPAEVTDIFISHAHGDHVGGLVTATGALAYPSATIHLSAPEWAAFQAEAAQSSDADKRLVQAIAPRVSAFEPGTPDAPRAAVVPLVTAIATPGHTPGHNSYEIGSGAGALIYLGDVAHHAVISVQRPAWTIQFDHDHEAGKVMREQTLATLAADHRRVFAGHFPFPGIGQIATAGAGFAWKSESDARSGPSR